MERILLDSLIQDKIRQVIWSLDKKGVGQEIWEQAWSQVDFDARCRITHHVRDKVSANMWNITFPAQRIHCKFKTLKGTLIK